MLRIRLDLASEPDDLRIDCAVEGFQLAAARQIHKKVAGKHAAGVVEEGGQHIELPGSQLDLAPVRTKKLAAQGVERPALEADDLVCLLLRRF
jgi:hypothetical protein